MYILKHQVDSNLSDNTRLFNTNWSEEDLNDFFDYDSSLIEKDEASPSKPIPLNY